MANLSSEERQSIPATESLSQRETPKKVEHGDEVSIADMSDLAARNKRQTFDTGLQTHVIKGHLDCEATHSGGMGHSGPATHFVQLQGEAEHQQTPVCDAHLGKIIENSISRGEYGVSKRRIHPEDVGKFAMWRGIQDREVRTYMERELYLKGMRGEDALFDRKTEDLGDAGKGGTRLDDLSQEDRNAKHLAEVKSRRTPEEQSSTLERQLELMRNNGGHPGSAAPTVDVDGTDMTLDESNAYVSSLRRKVDPKIPGARKGNTENYYMAGVKSPDGSSEGAPTSTRRFGLSKAGVPNPKGGRKKNTPTYDYDTSNEDKPGYTEEEMNANPDLRKSQEARLASGIPLEGIRPRGFSKTNNRRTEVFLNQMSQEAPEVGIIERFAAGRQARQSQATTNEMALNTEAERLRSIEATKNAARESRSAAFEVSKTPNL
jgi:hypothetical protein